MELTILTGASRGLGRAMAEQLLAPDHVLLTISRKPDRALEGTARAKGAMLEQWAADLADGIAAAARIEAWLDVKASGLHAAATLINNAGWIGRIGAIDDSEAETIAGVMRVGLEAPMLLTSAFLRATRKWPAKRRVLNISSGAGRRPIGGWAAYCAAKAGLDHFARVTAIDQARMPNPAKIVSLAPGVIDTDMQGQLRASDPAGFPDIAHFHRLKAEGQLVASEEAAVRVLAYLARKDFGSNPVDDLRKA